MTIKLGVVMDPIANIHFHKDSTLSLLLAAQAREHTIFYMEPDSLYVDYGRAYARMRPLTVFDDDKNWYRLGEAEDQPLDFLDCILMRQDPPFNLRYIYVTYMLELAEQAGVVVINRPSALRDCNEKFYTAWFPEFTAPTCVATNANVLKQFIEQHHDCVVKPLDSMGGAGIFRVTERDLNTNVMLETVTHGFTLPCLIQAYIPEIAQGDKRILIFNGEPADNVVVRMPSADDFRGNIAAGASVTVRPINNVERALVETIAPILLAKGLYLVGLDVIGDRISEINVTSPTCLRHIEKATDEKVSEKCMEMIDQLMAGR